jgi:glycine/D-amino acid oxidase-like deaminating enzyme
VGAGVVGAAIAYELSQAPHFQVTLVDQGSVAQGATSAALGICLSIISRKTKGRAWTLRHQSLQVYPQWLEQLQTLSGESIPHNDRGILKLFQSPEQLPKWQQLQALRQAQGYCLEILSPTQVQGLFPQVDLPSPGFAVYSPQDLQINPVALTQALVTAARIQGTLVQEHWPVETFTHVSRDLKRDKRDALGSDIGGAGADRHCQAIVGPRGSLEADWIILSGGLGSMALTQQLDPKIELEPVLGQAMKVRLPHSRPDLFPHPVITSNDIHVVPLGNRELWLGATVEFQGELRKDFKGKFGEQSDSALSDVSDPRLLEELWQGAIAFYPTLGEGEIIEQWSGLRPRPVDRSAPIIEQLPGYDNVIVATGHYRNGVLLAPATAQQVKTMMVGT